MSTGQSRQLCDTGNARLTLPKPAEVSISGHFPAELHAFLMTTNLPFAQLSCSAIKQFLNQFCRKPAEFTDSS